jgi:hypothetical protein
VPFPEKSVYQEVKEEKSLPSCKDVLQLGHNYFTI